jgi:hypothetical protein
MAADAPMATGAHGGAPDAKGADPPRRKLGHVSPFLVLGACRGSDDEAGVRPAPTFRTPHRGHVHAPTPGRAWNRPSQLVHTEKDHARPQEPHR